MRLVLLLGAALLACAAGVGSYVWISGAESDRDDHRINFQLTDMQGQLRTADEWDGKVVLLNFWAPWCEPCRAEIPLLVKLQSSYGEKGLQILGPALDKPEAVQRFANDYQINYPLFTDLDAVLSLQESYGDTRLPYTVLLDREGRVIYRHAGELQAESIEAQISAAINANN